MAAEQWRKSIERARMSAPAVISSAIAILAFGGVGLALAHTGRTRYAWGLWALGVALTVRLAIHLWPSLIRVAVARNSAALVGLAAVACAVGPYWKMPRIYPEPYVLVRNEKAVVDMVRERLQPGDDVAVIASDVLTMYGGWPELPVVREGKAVIAPMLIEGALRPWSPDPRLISETTTLWEQEYHVRFVVIYDDYWAQAQAGQGRQLREYVSRNFDLWQTMNFHSGDYYGLLRIYQRRPLTNNPPG
jgi:hypothetical protein